MECFMNGQPAKVLSGPFDDLKVWQAATELVISIYEANPNIFQSRDLSPD
jgi:hypothetical protein